MKRLGLIFGLLVSMSIPTTAAAQTAAPAGCQYVLGFKTLHDLDASDVGDCVDSQFLGNPNGDQWQHTTKGLMVWRKADNWTAFTNGYMSWLNGPAGLASRLNTQRFPWEGDFGAPGTTAVSSSTGNPAAAPAPATPGGSTLHSTLGSPATFATHADFQGYGFLWGPSDGQFGAIPAGDGTYTFYGSAATTSSCRGSPNTRNGAFTFTGTLDHVIGSSCTRLFGPGDGPAGWTFASDYAGGGQVVRFASGSRSGWLMPFHSEIHWKNPSTPDGLCQGAPCFYGGLGLAVSTDNGKTFNIAGQIMQASQPLSAFMGGGKNMASGYGSLVVADAQGKHLDNPPPDAGQAFFYLFFGDAWPGAPGACSSNICLGVARARYADVIAAALSGDPHQVARVFHKYDGASPDPWTAPATSDTPDDSGTAGTYSPLWTDESGGNAEVIYDRSFDVYLAAYLHGAAIEVRASPDLLHWSKPIGPAYAEPGRTLIYPTLIGDGEDPTIAAQAPRMYVQSFETFPNWATQKFESVQLMLSNGG